MKLSRAAVVAIATTWALSTPACGCFSTSIKRPYPEVKAAGVVDALMTRNDAAHSFRAESKMDYRVGGERVKGTVLIAGKRGAQIRFNAENPTGGNVAVDLACNGFDFKYVNNNENCQLSGPCSESAIAQLLRVSLEPDEFMLLAIGGAPLIEHTEAKLEWVADGGRERLTLFGRDGSKEILELSGDKDRHWDVVMAKLLTPEGKVDWKLRNKDFKTLTSEDGKTFRVPAKTLFEQPLAKADLLVEWKSRTINVELEDAMFEMEIPAGLPRCGQHK